MKLLSRPIVPPLAAPSPPFQLSAAAPAIPAAAPAIPAAAPAHPRCCPGDPRRSPDLPAATPAIPASSQPDSPVHSFCTYLLTDLGEPPRSPPVLYVDNKAMLALCREHRLEHRTKHIALRYFLARELQQRGQLRLAYVASQANTSDIFTKALQPCDHQRFCTMLGLLVLLCFALLDCTHVTSHSPRFTPYSLNLPLLLASCFCLLLALPLFIRLSHGQTPAPPCPFSPLPSPYRPSLPILTPPCPYFLSNAQTNDYDIRYHVRVSLNDSGEPIGVVIKKGADVALTVLTSNATWTNRTLSNAERAKLGGKLTPKARKGKQPPPPPPPLSYNYETSGTWLSASTLTADNGQTYKELADAMLAVPDTYSALIYTKTFENGVASGGFANVTKDGGEVSGNLAVKLYRVMRFARNIKHH
ncbi:unnamed protein product [Closterium sp. NIES-53]